MIKKYKHLIEEAPEGDHFGVFEWKYRVLDKNGNTTHHTNDYKDAEWWLYRCIEKWEEESKAKASDIQIGGDHYKDFPIQPGEFVTKNKLGYFPGSVVGRMCRYDKPTGKGLQDLEKAKHEIDLIIEWEGWEEK